MLKYDYLESEESFSERLSSLKEVHYYYDYAPLRANNKVTFDSYGDGISIARNIYSKISVKAYEEYAEKNGMPFLSAATEINKITKKAEAASIDFSESLKNVTVQMIIDGFFNGNIKEVSEDQFLANDLYSKKIADMVEKIINSGRSAFYDGLETMNSQDDGKKLKILNNNIKKINKITTNLLSRKNLSGVKAAAGEDILTDLFFSFMDKNFKRQSIGQEGKQANKTGSLKSKADGNMQMTLDFGKFLKQIEVPTTTKLTTVNNYTVHEGGFNEQTIGSAEVLDSIKLIIAKHIKTIRNNKNSSGLPNYRTLIGAILADATIAGTTGRALFSNNFYLKIKEDDVNSIDYNFMEQYIPVSFTFIGDLYAEYAADPTRGAQLKDFKVSFYYENSKNKTKVKSSRLSSLAGIEKQNPDAPDKKINLNQTVQLSRIKSLTSAKVKVSYKLNERKLG